MRGAISRLVVCVALLAAAIPGLASADTSGTSPANAIQMNGTMTGTVNPGQQIWYQIGLGSNSQAGFVMDLNPGIAGDVPNVGFNVDWTNPSGQFNADAGGYYRLGQGTPSNFGNSVRYYYSGQNVGAVYYIEVVNFSTTPVGFAVAWIGGQNPPPWLNPPAAGAATAAPAPAQPAPASSGSPPPPGPQSPQPAPAPAPAAPSGPPPSGATADQAIPISPSNNTVSGTIVGSTGGSVRFYTVNYQGANQPLNIVESFTPVFGNPAVGFFIYGPNSFSQQSAQTSSGVNAIASATYSAPAGGPILIQIYNYTDGGSVNYSLQVQGLAGGSSTTIQGGPANSSPDKAIDVTTINATVGGKLPTNTAQFFSLHYPGGGSPMTITMTGPPFGGANLAYGFNVYCPNPSTTPGQAPSPTLTGYMTGQDVNTETVAGTVAQTSAGICTLVVNNHWPNTDINYSMSITGMGGPAPAVSGNGDPQHAITLNSGQQGATETINAANDAAFGFFNVQYPGNQSKFWVSITYSDIGGAPLNALGFNAYYTDDNGNKQTATINPADDGTGIKSGGFFLQQQNPSQITVQAMDWQKGTKVAFVLYEVGAN